MSLAAMLAKRAPVPGKLPAMGGGPPMGKEPGGEPQDDPKAEPADEGVDAAGESATADFFAAYKANDAAAGWAALKEIHGLCADAEASGNYEGE
jgi:hypothetical protein